MAIDIQWERGFAKRMRSFAQAHSPKPGEISVSIKIRVVSGCFHREHSPQAYQIIDQSLRRFPPEAGWEEHESGPEILTWVKTGVDLATKVICLVTAILIARSRGIEKGDNRTERLEVVVRRVDDGKTVREETILRLGHKEKIDQKLVEKKLNKAIKRLSKK